MRKIASLILVVAFVVAGCGSSVATAANAAATPGAITTSTPPPASQAAAQSGGNVTTGCSTGTYKGFKTNTYCGPAKGTVTIAGTAYQVSGGLCIYDVAVGFAANIGTSVTGSTDVTADGPQYLFVASFPGAGASAAGVIHGVPFSILDGDGANTVTIAPDHKSGSASGVAGPNDDPVTVAFTC